MHALLAAAAALTAIPWPAAALVATVAVAHAWWRWPPAPPVLLVLAEDGDWYVAGHGATRFTLGPRTRLAPLWLRLDLRANEGRQVLDIVLVADELDDAAWRRLAARLRRAPPPPSPTRAANRPAPTGDLR